MSKYIPEVLKEFMLPFNWDVRKVWMQEADIEEIMLSELEFMFELPYWSSKPNSGMLFDITLNQVLDDLAKYPHQTERVENADIQYPIEFIFENGTYYILDGLHRLARHKLLDKKTVKVRKHKLEICANIQVNNTL